MAAYSNFRSSSQIESERDELREARRIVLEKAKEDYEKAERRREKARQAGEGTWMLQSVTDRIDKEQKVMEKAKKKKKEKKKKKKHKSKGKRKKRHSSSSDTDSSDEEASWMEKTSEQSEARPVVGPCLQRDSWMDGPLVTDIIPTVTRAELRERQKGEEEKKKAEAAKLLEQPGQHTRELNPYWKDGGSGVPENKPPAASSTPPAPSAAGDGGLSWLRKAYDRCKQQAQDEGRSLEDVVADRYGSLEKLESMIREAEKSSGHGRGRQRNQHFRQDYRGHQQSRFPGSRPGLGSNAGNRNERSTGREDSLRGDESGAAGSRNRGRNERDSRERERRRDRGSSERDRGRDRDGSERDSREKERRRDRGSSERDRRGDGDSSERDRRRDGDSRERDEQRGRDRHERDGRGDRNSRERDADDGKESGEHGGRDSRPAATAAAGGDRLAGKRRFARPKDDSDSDNELPRPKRTFMKPNEDADNFRNKSSGSSASSLKGRFAKPVDSDEDDHSHSRKHELPVDRGTREWGDRSRSRGGARGGWKKPGCKKEERNSEKRSSQRDERHQKYSESDSESDHRKSGSSSSSSSSAESDGEEETKRKEEPAPVKILSEDEMNSLGARILRAELMGEEDLAKQLKAQLEQAQKAKDAAPRSQGPKDTATKVKDKEEENVVVLTRTGRDGMVRPLPEQEFDGEGGGRRRRRKKKNVETHGTGGERTRYFDDDDKHDLKTLVQMEKLGTAEDQNAMFARLAGRSAEKTDEDFQVDDVFVSKAAQQQSGARNEEKERGKAIFEHRKVSAAMEKCQYCFSKVPKHLIIAIGTKVYLSLPAHRSLTPGHCLIVPMQHTPAATALDEDVWQEIQAFRKQLVQMFTSQDQDVVFMETSMHLRHFPHMTVECIPLDREIGDLAPIYFKKAMQDAGPEWNSNKKVVELSKKDIRHSVPKGFPYFSVDFGLQGGFAHVIEEEIKFPAYFGREIVGGMIDAEPGLWRKPHQESFEEQRRKVLEFEQWWKPFDITT